MSADEPHIAFGPHCGNTAPQRIVFTHSYHTAWYDTRGRNDDYPGPECEAIVCICETCDEMLLYDGIARSEVGEWPLLAYPRNPELDSSVPEPVRDVYTEAARVKNQAPNAFGVMIRRALEAICDDRQVESGPLARRLQNLASRGDIPPTLAELTDVLRVLGNVGAHATESSVTVPMTWAMDEFFRVIVEYVYVAPSKEVLSNLVYSA